MKNILFLAYVTLACVFSILNTSGLGIAYGTPEKTNIFIALLFYIILSKKEISKIYNTNSQVVLFTILSFVIFPLLLSNSWDGFTYLMMIPLVYCFSKQKVNEVLMLLSGYIVAAIGIFIMYVYTKTEILSGWNDNHISMIGLFSYAYYSISLYGNLTGRKLTIGVSISVLFVIMLNSTNSRSATIFILLALVLAYRGDWFKILVRKRMFVFYALNAPLIISFIVISFPNLFIFKYFERWSIENFGKSAFNGRDILWSESFGRLFDTYLLGEGEFLINHHNSAVAVISVFGIIGYLCWYKVFAKLIRFMRQYINDNIVFGCISSFFLIFWQQSFDLGFVSPFPNMIPYMILGVGLARIRHIKSNFKKSNSFME